MGIKDKTATASMVQVLFLVTQTINYLAVNCRTDPTQPKQCLFI